MGVIHEHGHVVSGVRIIATLEPSGHIRGIPERRKEPARFEAERDADPSAKQKIGEIVRPPEFAAQEIFSVLVPHGRCDTRCVEVRSDDPHVCRVMPNADHRRALRCVRARGAIGQCSPELVVDVEHEMVWRELEEEPGFRFAVGVQRAVVVEMILREIRERRDAECQGV